MQHKEKLIELMRSDNPTALTDWVQQQPLILQPDIAREFKELMEEIFTKAGLTQELVKLNEFDNKINEYEESILDEQLASLKVDILKR